MYHRAYPLVFLLPFLSNPCYKEEYPQADMSISEEIPPIIMSQTPPSPKPISKYSSAGLLTIISSTHNCSDFIGASQEMVRRMKEKKLSEVFLGKHGHIYTLDQEREITLEEYVNRSSFPLSFKVHHYILHL